ncbi:unnamed protein product [Paramecium octaurelia]|uniref:Uncharacterized protein n=1 Tax=Paramecium octaurelia TaxID=43137 RepID=A0A8S1X1S3_PAROT|nr:unnamed protein product [Paramecium octaurelia]
MSWQVLTSENLNQDINKKEYGFTSLRKQNCTQRQFQQLFKIHNYTCLQISNIQSLKIISSIFQNVAYKSSSSMIVIGEKSIIIQFISQCLIWRRICNFRFNQSKLDKIRIYVQSNQIWRQSSIITIFIINIKRQDEFIAKNQDH